MGPRKIPRYTQGVEDLELRVAAELTSNQQDGPPDQDCVDEHFVNRISLAEMDVPRHPPRLLPHLANGPETRMITIVARKKLDLGIPDSSVYQTRHSDASIDCVTMSRSLAEIQWRGFWQCQTSENQCEKVMQSWCEQHNPAGMLFPVDFRQGHPGHSDPTKKPFIIVCFTLTAPSGSMCVLFWTRLFWHHLGKRVPASWFSGVDPSSLVYLSKMEHLDY